MFQSRHEAVATIQSSCVAVASSSVRHDRRVAIGGPICRSILRARYGIADHLQDRRRCSKWETVNHYRDSPTVLILFTAHIITGRTTMINFLGTIRRSSSASGRNYPLVNVIRKVAVNCCVKFARYYRPTTGWLKKRGHLFLRLVTFEVLTRSAPILAQINVHSSLTSS